MEKALCGANCANCGYGKNGGCEGCNKSKGCPFGKQCFIYQYIKSGGTENYEKFKKQLIDEFNSLGIPGMPKIDSLYALNGEYVNLAYPMPSGENIKLLDDKAIYLGNQVECEFKSDEDVRCFGVVAGLNFLLVSEYGENGDNPEIVLFTRR